MREEAVRQFLFDYVEQGNLILKALEEDEWQKVWHLLKERDRLLRRLIGNERKDVLFMEMEDGFLAAAKEALEIDKRCVHLLREKMEWVRGELKNIQTMKHWNRNRASQHTPLGRRLRCLA
jgi:hypothetical protein